MLEAPSKIVVALDSELEVKDAATLTPDEAFAFEHRLMGLSDAISDRFFLQGRNAAPTKKIGGLA
jgi:hypothetical protein